MTTENPRWLRMRNDQNIRTQGQIHWRPLAYDNRLWINPGAFEQYLGELRLRYPLDITSISSKKEKKEEADMLPGLDGTAAVPVIRSKKKKPERVASATLDLDEKKARIMLDSTLIAEQVQDALRSNIINDAFTAEFGKQIDREVKKKLRILVLQRFVALSSTRPGELPKEFMVDYMSTVIAVMSEIAYVALFTLLEVFKAVNGSFDKSEFIGALGMLLPSFILFYAACYKSLGAVYDLSDELFEPTDNESTRKLKLASAYFNNIFSSKNVPKTVPLPDLTIPLARSFLNPPTLIKGGTQPPEIEKQA
jgi:hypothetical protein